MDWMAGTMRSVTYAWFGVISASANSNPTAPTIDNPSESVCRRWGKLGQPWPGEPDSKPSCCGNQIGSDQEAPLMYRSEPPFKPA